MALAVLCCAAAAATDGEEQWGRPQGGERRPPLEPRTRTPNSNPKPEFRIPIPNLQWTDGVLLSLFVFSPQPLPSGEVAMAPEPDFKGLGADHQKGYFLPGRVHASASMGTDRAFSSLALCFVTHQVCRGDGEEDGKDQRKALLPYCIAFISTELFRGKLRFLREFASAFAKERKGNGDRKRER